jgi:hypothetical protein
MFNEALHRELTNMRAEDRRTRDELLASGELGGHYVPRMETVHRNNASALRELIAIHGWPCEDIAGKDGAEAAWFIVQHAIGEPDFQRQTLRTLRSCAAEGRIPGWHAAYLEDRIALYEGRPQRYGTQWMDDLTDGRTRPWKLADPERVDELRAQVGLGPLHPAPEPGPALAPDQRREIEESNRWWQQWLESKGWRQTPSENPFLESETALDHFIETWERGELPRADWSHAAHVAVAAYFAFDLDPDPALIRTREGILRHNECVGTANTEDSGYHETLTRFWSMTIRALVRSRSFASRFEAVRVAVETFGPQRDLHRRHYSFDVVRDRPARREWIAPDENRTRDLCGL